MLDNMRMWKIDMRNKKRRDVVEAVVNRQESIHKETRRFVEEQEGQFQLVYLPPALVARTEPG